MSRFSPGTKASLLTLTMLAFLGTAGFLPARQTTSPPKSKSDDESGSQAKPKPNSKKTKAKTDGKSKARHVAIRRASTRVDRSRT